MPIRPLDLYRQADAAEREAKTVSERHRRATLLAFAKRLRQKAEELERRCVSE